jgi:hypothetical protein
MRAESPSIQQIQALKGHIEAFEALPIKIFDAIEVGIISDGNIAGKHINCVPSSI